MLTVLMALIFVASYYADKKILRSNVCGKTRVLVSIFCVGDQLGIKVMINRSKLIFDRPHSQRSL